MLKDQPPARFGSARILREIFAAPPTGGDPVCTGECQYSYNPDTRRYEHTGGACAGDGCPDCLDSLPGIVRDLLFLVREDEPDHQTFPCGADQKQILENALRKVYTLQRDKQRLRSATSVLSMVAVLLLGLVTYLLMR